MARHPTPIRFTDEERGNLTAWIRADSSEQRHMARVRMILAAAEGQCTLAIARALGTRPARVAKWRTRFGHAWLAGMLNAPRSGASANPDAQSERRIPAQLDQPPPGPATWPGQLLAGALRDVSVDQVWLVMRRRDISCGAAAAVGSAPPRVLGQGR